MAIAKGYNPRLYYGYKAAVKIILPYAHMVLVHDGCGGQVDPIEMYWDWELETVGESQYCHKCENDIRWDDTVSAVTRRAWKRALVLDAPLTDSDWPAQEYEE